jgi:hypothetical protein
VHLPTDQSWDPADLAGAEFLARSADGRNVVTGYDTGMYRALYVSYMPEYVPDGSHFESMQLLYDAIVCNRAPTSARRASWGEVKARFQR